MVHICVPLLFGASSLKETLVKSFAQSHSSFRMCLFEGKQGWDGVIPVVRDEFIPPNVWLDR
jgi:hypothetical protein